MCKNCGYKFDSFRNEVDNCPYCDKKGIEEEKSAEEIVKEVEKLLE